MHVEIKVLMVVLAARQIGEEALCVVVVARIDADLRVDGRVHEAAVAQVAVQEGEDRGALGVGELIGEDIVLLLGPTAPYTGRPALAASCARP